MNTRPLNRPRGVALILVLIAMVSLSILAGLFAYSMKVEARLAMNSNNDAEMEWMGRSGAEAAKYVLALQMGIAQEPYDALNQTWAGGPGSMAASNSPLAEIHLPWTIPLGSGQITIQPLVDLDRKANINNAPQQVLEQALVLMGVDAGEYPAIASSILDWIDADDAERNDGAESGYYEASDPPYFAKNGPIDDMSELQLIRGITPELYWGPNSASYIPSRIQKDPNTRLGFNADAPVYPVGFVDLFTAISSGRININTAPPHVLQLIPMVDERIASEIIRLRSGMDGADGTDDDVPFRNPGELINAGLNPGAVQQMQGLCDVRSRVFEVKIRAEISGYARNFKAILVRNGPRDIQVVSFHADE